MSIELIVSQIDAEIAKLTQVRALLTTASKSAAKTAALKKNLPAGKIKMKKKRILSPEARKRIADAQRKRWAAQRAASKQ